ncbi:lysophospholipase [Leptolyngbyaceae cyanobacterium CCMR0082]|uniref:Lysophospholipase n=1 Tax=Adonisia turfae CCMR0082 TaxID=2304604 RepID=A0A6M0S9W6_9CYAN|nr:alpha/beta fold hydrolase [Adonisia turfae]NEZ64863.1 lysophospholipase [Adonisia turfae CCMR0082]
MVDTQSLPFILFVQHGWHDTHRRIHRLGISLADPNTEVIAPNLGLIKTWWRIDPLIDQVEQVASATHQHHPNRPWRIVGHSMGGLIWLELLERHPEWWSHVSSVSLVSSPVGGADLGRIFDPFRWGIGIARDLGTDRRQMAENLARHIPMQTIASDYDGGSDGTVPLQCSQFRHAHYTQLQGIRHDNTKDHPDVTTAIQNFWSILPKAPTVPEDPLEDTIIAQMQAIPGITDAHHRNFNRSTIWATLTHGFSLRIWRHPLGIHHVFLADAQQRCRFAGFVGWADTQGLYQRLAMIKQRHCKQ